MAIQRALLSVSDKSGLVDFAKGLDKHGIELLSTGGTSKTLREAGLTVIQVATETIKHPYINKLPSILKIWGFSNLLTMQF